MDEAAGVASRAFSLLSTGRAASRDAGGGFSPPPPVLDGRTVSVLPDRGRSKVVLALLSLEAA